MKSKLERADFWFGDLEEVLRDHYEPEPRCTFPGDHLEPPEYEDPPSFVEGVNEVAEGLEEIGQKIAALVCSATLAGHWIGEAPVAHGICLDAELMEFIERAACEAIRRQRVRNLGPVAVVTTNDLQAHLDKLKGIVGQRAVVGG